MCWKADKVCLKWRVKTNLRRALPVFLSFSVGKYQRLLNGSPARSHVVEGDCGKQSGGCWQSSETRPRDQGADFPCIQERHNKSLYSRVSGTLKTYFLKGL